MTIKPLYLIIVAVAFGILAVYAFQVTSEKNALQDAHESLKSDTKQEIERLERERDSIAEIKQRYYQSASEAFSEGEALEEENEKLKNTDYENEPYHINDADSLRDLISRRFHES